MGERFWWLLLVVWLTGCAHATRCVPEAVTLWFPDLDSVGVYHAVEATTICPDAAARPAGTTTEGGRDGR